MLRLRGREREGEKSQRGTDCFSAADLSVLAARSARGGTDGEAAERISRHKNSSQSAAGPLIQSDSLPGTVICHKHINSLLEKKKGLRRRSKWKSGLLALRSPAVIVPLSGSLGRGNVWSSFPPGILFENATTGPGPGGSVWPEVWMRRMVVTFCF